MDTQLVLLLSFYYFLRSTSSLQTEKMKTEKTLFFYQHLFVLLLFWVLWSVSSSDIPRALQRIPPSPSSLSLALYTPPRLLARSAPWLGNLTEPYNHWKVQMKKLHIYVLWAKYSVSPKCTYWDPNPNVLVWEVGTWKASVTSVKLSQRGLVSLLWEERHWEHFCHLLP